MSSPNPETSDAPQRVPDAFIPYQRNQLLELCLKDGALSLSEQTEFRQFGDLFAAYTHFQFHQQLEDLKDNYWCFDPDCITADCPEDDQDRNLSARTVVDRFETLAELANFRKLTDADIIASFEDSTLIQLKTDVDLEDFHQYSCFVRGETRRTERVQGSFRQVEVECEIYERVLLLLHFKDLDYFAGSGKKRKKVEDLGFTPGMIYVYFYKDVPKDDLELLFPNVKMSMTPKDKLMLSVPAVGAGIAAIVKVTGKITLVVAALAITLSWDWLIDLLPGAPPTVNQFAALTALFTVVMTLSMLAFKQWDTYKNKRTKFLKLVSENLFYRNLASNQSVFHRILDSAEEEECKEALLVYYHILTNPNRTFTPQQLDAHIEAWMKTNFGHVVDFDIDGPIQNLQLIRGKDTRGQTMPLLEISPQGTIMIPALKDALHILDHLWDHAYEYSS